MENETTTDNKTTMNHKTLSMLEINNPRAIIVELLSHYRAEYLAQVAGVKNISSVYRWANGTQQPTPNHWRKLLTMWRGIK